MSKLAKAIQSEIDRHNVRASRTKRLNYADVNYDTKIVETEYAQTEYDREYRVQLGVKFQTQIWMNERDFEDPEIRKLTEERIKRAMIEEIFGEFRPMLYNLHAATYDGDYHKIRDILQQIENTMFNELEEK